MNAKYKGRAVVLALVLALILSVPVLAGIYEPEQCVGIGPDGEGYPAGCPQKPVPNPYDDVGKKSLPKFLPDDSSMILCVGIGPDGEDYPAGCIDDRGNKKALPSILPDDSSAICGHFQCLGIGPDGGGYPEGCTQ